MATVKSIITLALSKLGVASALKGARAEDLALGLTTIQSLYMSFVASGALGPARDVIVSDDYTARENDRIYRAGGTAMSITLPDIVQPTECPAMLDSCFYDWPAPSGHGHPPRDGSFVIITDKNTAGTEVYIREGFTNRWVAIHELTLAEPAIVRNTAGNIVAMTDGCEAPFSVQDANGLAAYLATQLSDHYGAQPSSTTIHDSTNWQAAMVSRFGSRRYEQPDPDRYF